MRAATYIRASLDRSGEGAAVSRQLEDADRIAQMRDWTVVARHADNNISAAGKKARPGFEALLRDIEQGRANAIIAWSLDRLTRNRRDTIRLIETCEARGVVIALVRGSDIDMSTPAGRLVADVLSGVARHEIDQKGDRQRRAQQQAAEQGRPAGGRRAFGYTSDGLSLIEDEAEHVRQAFADLLAGASLKSIARRWNEAGLTTTAGGPWRHDNVRGVLRNARYAGLRTYRGEIVGPAVWPALVSREDYEAVAAVLSMPERRTTVSTARKYLLPGLALCWKCGSDVATGHTRHGKRVYVCRANKCVSRKADPVDALVRGGVIEGVPVAGLVVERLSRRDAADLLVTPTDDMAEARARADELRRRLDDLAMGLEEGLLSLAAVRRSSERLRAELAAVDERIKSAATVDVLTTLVAATDVGVEWARYELRQQREVIDALMTITLLRPERGHRAFDPDSVRIDWKVTA